MNGWDFDFFSPNQNLSELIPFLLWILVFIGVLVFVALMLNGLHNWNRRSLAWRRFHVIARRYTLTKREINFVRRLIAQNKIENPSSILTNEEKFERLAVPVENQGRTYERNMVVALRYKLFGRNLRDSETIRSTHRLPTGIRLFIQHISREYSSIWGQLVDVDEMGLVVILTDYPHTAIPMHKDANLEVTAYIPNHSPIIFRTWVKSVIPGPRKMVVLGHSSFVLDRKNRFLEEHIVGPQDYPILEKEPKPIFQSIETPMSRNRQ